MKRKCRGAGGGSGHPSSVLRCSLVQRGCGGGGAGGDAGDAGGMPLCDDGGGHLVVGSGRCQGRQACRTSTNGVHVPRQLSKHGVGVREGWGSEGRVLACPMSKKFLLPVNFQNFVDILRTDFPAQQEPV